MTGGALGWLDRLLDTPEVIDSMAGPLLDPLRWPGYGEQHAAAGTRTGTAESVVVARGRVRGGIGEAVVVAWEFGFLGGSIGVAAGGAIAGAYDTARAEGLPVVLLPATGGSRMQEGMAALAQMAVTSVAALDHAGAGLLQVAVLRHPTTGGVLASQVNLADVLWALPGAMVGFAGPRVAEAATGDPLPAGSHSAEGARAAGLVDEVIAEEDVADRLARVLAWQALGAPAPKAAAADGVRPPSGSVWEQIERSRAPDRARADAFLAALDVATELHGDRAGSDDPSVRVVLARLGGRPLVVVALDRAGRGGRVTPGGYRKAWRGLRLASRCGVPLVVLVDTPGADPSAASEAGGVAHHIARTFAEMLAVASPTVTVVIGEGGSGGALALSVADVLLIQEHATYSVIAPESAAAILHRDTGRAADVAEQLDPTALRLVALGIADELVAEPGGQEVAAVWAAVERHLDRLAAVDDRVAVRRARWREWRPT